MFRRLKSGLPKDPVFPADLKGLGYSINDQDEIRSIENPKAYFKFFLTKNDRYNAIQREAMNEVIRNIITDRLGSLGMEKIRLPLGANEDEPNVPIFISSNIMKKTRVIILLYEANQDLGVFAHRIIGGKGGINHGSAVDFVKYIQSLKSSCDNADSPGIIIANMGQLRWWRRGKKAVTQSTWFALPQRSAVDVPFRFDPEKNTIPGNRTGDDHVNYIFNHVVEKLVDPKAKINVIGVSEGAVRAAMFLEAEQNWAKWGPRVVAFAGVASYYHATDMKNGNFGEFLRDRGRVYLLSSEPCGTLLAGPNGRRQIPAHGCPAFSLGEPYYTETMLPKGYKEILDWFQEVAADEGYANAQYEIFDSHTDSDEEVPQEGGIELDASEGDL